METVSVKRTLKINIAGGPVPDIEKGPAVSAVAVLPDRFPFIKPRLLVKKGDRVKIGSPLFADKDDKNLKFLSPGAGTVKDIQYGHRRTITRIVIETDKTETGKSEEAVPFEPIDEKRLSEMDRDRLIGVLMDQGLWPLIRNLPYRAIPPPDEKPASIWVSMDPADPFQVPSHIYLKGNEAHFVRGIRALERLGAPVCICESQNRPIEDETLAPLVTHRASGPYPVEDPGVLLYHTKKSADENRAWFMTGQDVVLLGRGLGSGRYPTSRIVAVSGLTNGNGSGGSANLNRFIQTRMGAPLSSLVRNPETLHDRRWIAGGLFRGRTAAPDGYMGFYETSLALIEEAKDPELFGFLRPGLFKPTVSRTFLYALHKKHFPAKADMRGEERACINCGKCEQVCPVDIMVQYAYKCIYAGELEEALMHGLLDCVACGLCSYVCPAKIDLAESLKTTKHAYYEDRI